RPDASHVPRRRERAREPTDDIAREIMQHPLAVASPHLQRVASREPRNPLMHLVLARVPTGKTKVHFLRRQPPPHPIKLGRNRLRPRRVPKHEPGALLDALQHVPTAVHSRQQTSSTRSAESSPAPNASA